MVVERGFQEHLQEECDIMKPNCEKDADRTMGADAQLWIQVQDIDEKYRNEDEANKQQMNEAKNARRVQDKGEREDEKCSQSLIPLDDVCIKQENTVKQPRCGITKLARENMKTVRLPTGVRATLSPILFLTSKRWERPRLVMTPQPRRHLTHDVFVFVLELQVDQAPRKKEEPPTRKGGLKPNASAHH